MKYSLAERLRPDLLTQIVGQDKVLRPGGSLLHQVQSGGLASLILWGPPGSGKTTAALCLRRAPGVHFSVVQASELSTQRIREILEEAYELQTSKGLRSLLFVDEIHRLTKLQQDAFLSALEKGHVYLIGATTENPHYELTRAMVSRCHIIRFELLSRESLLRIFESAISELEVAKDFLAPSALDLLLELSGGDGRRFLNSLEACYRVYLIKRFQVQEAEVVSTLGASSGFRAADKSYISDLISALIKSIRGSDPDAAIMYLAQTLELGIDPLIIARRLIVLASEDIGNADPRALGLTVSVYQACEFIGMPEARIPLAQVVVYLSAAPKSNSSYLAIGEALAYVRKATPVRIPRALCTSQKDLASSSKIELENPHETHRGWVKQSYRSEEDANRVFFRPQNRGFEKHIIEHLRWVRGQETKLD